MALESGTTKAAVYAIPSLAGANRPGAFGPPTLTSRAAVCSWASLTFRGTSDIRFILTFPANV